MTAAAKALAAVKKEKKLIDGAKRQKEFRDRRKETITRLRFVQ